MIGGYDCTSCKSGGAKKKATVVKCRRGGNSVEQVSSFFNSAVQSIKMAGGARKRKVRKGVKRGGSSESDVQDETSQAQGAKEQEMAGGARKRRVRRAVKRVRKGGFESEEFEEFKQEMAGGAKRKRKVGRVGKGGSGTEEFQTELAGGAKKRKGAKKSLNPYIKFVKKHFQSMKKKNPNDTAPQIMKKIAVEYKKQK